MACTWRPRSMHMACTQCAHGMRVVCTQLEYDMHARRKCRFEFKQHLYQYLRAEHRACTECSQGVHGACMERAQGTLGACPGTKGGMPKVYIKYTCSMDVLYSLCGKFVHVSANLPTGKGLFPQNLRKLS